MKSRTRGQKLKPIQGDGPNWVLVIGGALLSTITVRLGFKLKKALESKQDNSPILKGNEKTANIRSFRNCRSHSSLNSFGLDENSCFNCGSGEHTEDKNLDGQILTDPEVSLPIVTVPPREYDLIWVTSPTDRTELPPKPFNHSCNSDSPRVSDSGSDIFSKREVIQKLRQQLKRRDDMILEIQDQITELQTALSSQMSLSNSLQTQLEFANRELFESEREIQRLRKTIADHCVAVKPEGQNGHSNGFVNGDGEYEVKRSNGDDRIDMLRKEIGELKEVIGDKEFLVQSYKEQKAELSAKIKELQQRLDSQLPHIL